MLLLPAVAWGQADSLITQPDATNSADTYLDSVNNKFNYGIATSAQASWSDGNSALRRILIRFDTISVIPSNAIIDSAYLILYWSQIVNFRNLSYHRLIRTWSAGTAWGAVGVCSWDSSSYSADNGGASDSAWTSRGGDFTGAAIATITSLINAAYDTLDVKSSVQNWVDGTWDNYGFLFKQVDESDAGENKLHTIKTSDDVAATRPKLIIYYTIPSPTTGSIVTRGVSSLNYPRGYKIEARYLKYKYIARARKKK